MAHQSIEAEFVLRAARPTLDEDEVAAVRDLASGVEDAERWPHVVDQAYRHHLLPLLGRNVVQHGLHPRPPGANTAFRYEELFTAVYQANQVRNEALLRELEAVLRELARHGVHPLLRKGLVLTQEVYQDLGSRRSYDIDLMIEPEQVPVLKEVMPALGYATGTVSANRRVVEPRSRAEAAYWAMHVPNLSFRRQTSERFANGFVIDVLLDQFLPGSGYHLPAGGLTERGRPIRVYGVPTRAFDHEEMLVDLATHLFKEATSLHYVQIGKDLTLAKFLDIAGYATTQPVDWDRFGALCARYGIEEPVHYALHYTETVYPGSIPEHVLESTRPDDTGFLREIGTVDKDVHRWQEDFLHRLFDPTRARRAAPSRAPL